MNSQQFESVWDAIESPPEEAEEMKRRSGLMIMLTDHIAQHSLSSPQAAELFGVSQQRISLLKKGKISQLELEVLEGMAKTAGLAIPWQINQTEPVSAK